MQQNPKDSQYLYATKKTEWNVLYSVSTMLSKQQCNKVLLNILWIWKMSNGLATSNYKKLIERRYIYIYNP